MMFMMIEPREGVQLYMGDSLTVLKTMPDATYHMCATSPPYWGLRNYGTAPQVWGGVSNCVHEWVDYARPAADGSWTEDGNSALRANHQGCVSATLRPVHSAFCARCGAWRGSLGLEPTPELYVEHLVEVMREVRRVLRPEGTLWLVLGDSYSAGGGKQVVQTKNASHGLDGMRMATPGIAAKQLIGIPWRVAFALQADGWWLRSDIIWAKGVSFLPDYAGSCMPESVRDRPTKGHEYVFLLSKSADYFWDAEAVKEASVYPSDKRKPYAPGQVDSRGNGHDRNGGVVTNRDASTRNLRTVWVISPEPYRGAHFATYPTRLVEPCIKAGTSAKGCCPKCGAPWERVTERTNEPDGSAKGSRFDAGKTFARDGGDRTQPGERTLKKAIGWRPTCDCRENAHTESAYPEGSTAKRLALLRQAAREAGGEYANEVHTVGWRPTCECVEGVGDFAGADRPVTLHYPEPVPCTVLDPFMGSGTTGYVARLLGRQFVGIELNPKYVELARERIGKAQAPLPGLT